ncbi:hypothetical protein Tco_1157169 [Tanacetum coccineum]
MLQEKDQLRLILTLDYLTDYYELTFWLDQENQGTIHADSKAKKKEANKEAEALRKKPEQDTENLVTQAETAKSSSTNIFSTVSTTAKASGTNFVNTVSIPVSTASPNEGLSISDITNSQEDDSEIPPLEDIHQDTTDGIFTHSSYDDEGAKADFTNLGETFEIQSLDPSIICLMGKGYRLQSGCTKIRRMKRGWLSGTKQIYQWSEKSFLYGKIDEEVTSAPRACEVLGVMRFEALKKSRISDEFNGESHFLSLAYKSKPETGGYTPILGEHSSYMGNCIIGTAQSRQVLEAPTFSVLELLLYMVRLTKARMRWKPVMLILWLVLGFQVTPKTLSINAVQKILDSEYAGANLDRKNPHRRLSISGRDSLLGNAKSKPLWPLLQQKPNMLLLQAAVGKIQYIIRRQSILLLGTTSYEMLMRRNSYSITFVKLTTSEAVWKSHVCITRKSWPCFKSKRLHKFVRSEDSSRIPCEVFEDMRLCRPSKEYLQLEKTEGNVEFHEVIDFDSEKLYYPERSLVISDQAKEIKLLKAKITKLKKQAKPVIKHHKAYLKSVSLQQRFPRKSFSKKHRVHKESVSKQGRKKAKGESSVQRDPLFDVMPEDKIDHMETENAQSEGRTREMVDEDKEFDEVRLSTEDVVSTDKEGVSTDFEKVSTDRPIVSTDGSKVSTDEQIEGTDEQVEGTEEIFEGTEEQREGTEEKVESTEGQIKGTEDQTKEEIATQASQTSTQTPTSMIFGDDETIATLLLNMSQAKAASKEKEKGVELKDVEEIDRPRPTSQRSLLTLKPLPKIDPKDKGKKKIEEEDESESEDDDIPQAVKKFKQLESDEEMARKIQEEWEAEEVRNKIAEEEATNEALIKNFDDIKARIEADRILAEKLQTRREAFTIEERAKFVFMIKLLCTEENTLRSTKIRGHHNRPPTKLDQKMNKKDSSKDKDQAESKEEVKEEG